jgi:hypothetical protein
MDGRRHIFHGLENNVNYIQEYSPHMRTFFHGKKIHCIGENHIFQVKIWWNFAKKTTTLLDCGLCHLH